MNQRDHLSRSRDDAIRDRILRYLLEGRKRRASGFKTTEIEKALREEDVKQQEVRANLPYLVDLGWIVREEKERNYRSKGGTFQSAPETRYRISAAGVDLVNGMKSPYSQNTGRYAGIHIENVHGAVILGDNNIASVHAVSVVPMLDELARAVELCEELSDGQKHDYSSDLATLRATLTRQEPNKGVITSIIDSLAPLCNVESLASLLERLTTTLQSAGLL